MEKTQDLDMERPRTPDIEGAITDGEMTITKENGKVAILKIRDNEVYEIVDAEAYGKLPPVDKLQRMYDEKPTEEELLKELAAEKEQPLDILEEVQARLISNIVDAKVSYLVDCGILFETLYPYFDNDKRKRYMLGPVEFITICDERFVEMSYIDKMKYKETHQYPQCKEGRYRTYIKLSA